MSKYLLYKLFRPSKVCKHCWRGEVCIGMEDATRPWEMYRFISYYRVCGRCNGTGILGGQNTRTSTIANTYINLNVAQ